MRLTFIPLATLTVLCVSGGLACLIAIIVQKTMRRSFGRHRLTIAVLFFSGAVVCLTLLLIFVPFPRIFLLVDALYYGAIFVLIFIGTLFYRTVGFFLLIAYALTAGITIFTITSWAPAAHPIELEIFQEKILIDNAPFSVDSSQARAASAKKTLSIAFAAVRSPEIFVLPLPLQRLKPLGTQTESDAAEFSPEFSNVFFATVFRMLETMQKFSTKLAGSCSSDSVFRIFYAEVPYSSIFPLLYLVTPNTHGMSVSFTVFRLL